MGNKRARDKRRFMADFETTVYEGQEHTEVWAAALTEIYGPPAVSIDHSIEDFFNRLVDLKESIVVYFHNLKFDCQFILTWLFKNDFIHVEDRKNLETKTFGTLISDKGLFYSIEVIFYRNGKNVNKVTFVDSLKLIPLSVKAIAESFHLPISKLEIDYDSHNNLPIGHPLTKEEIDYITNDVKIVAYAIKYFEDQGLTKMTIGSCALNEYKSLINKKNFDRWFPTPKYHDDVKQSYRGGFTYLNPEFANKTIGNGIVLDVNSLYPSVMYDSYLPYGRPIFFWGEYEEDILYPLYTQMFRCQFELKPGKIPTIQIKHGGGFVENEYLTSSKGKEVTLESNVKELGLDSYNIYDLINKIASVPGKDHFATGPATGYINYDQSVTFTMNLDFEPTYVFYATETITFYNLQTNDSYSVGNAVMSNLNPRVSLVEMSNITRESFTISAKLTGNKRSTVTGIAWYAIGLE